MVRASLTLTVPERVWIGTVSREFPEARFRVRSVRSADELGVGLVEISADDIETVVSEMETHDPVHSVTPLQSGQGRALVQIEADEPVLLRLLERTGIPIETPFDIVGGEVEWTLTTTRHRLSELGSELDRSELQYVVNHVWDSAQFERVLTERQQEVVQAAIDAGYYDSPRDCTQEDLAERLNMAKSTCSDILHRAEEHIVKHFQRDPSSDYTARKKPA
ncbi:helix-turn-helix domain-containing protein [Halapricum hydrolyticum]|uniref:Helix-turn-helix domain-containing protein n=1 Tax=Halapricum hydrolyticum TaxID=2979991 RepID=A0AAE3I8T0_9EURY|nr:helix-turn-helix domain-containing protein [Halapricum hydrolyticum]MCU4716939.1 helix-turn-helix domain-containing protein [Halapricum hydrolyticum]MCU4725456.1 helix-turn-helix domain-containing protein [Halapricum hydrolyticum]